MLIAVYPVCYPQFSVMLIEWVCSRRGMALSDVAVEENGLKL